MAWWAAGLAVYLALVPEVSAAEVVVGAVLTLAAACTAVVAGHAFGSPPPPGALRWRHVWWLPVDVARDAVSVSMRLARHLRTRRGLESRFDEIELSVPDDADPRSARTYGVLLLSASPSCYVADVDVRDAQRDLVRVHRLGRANRSERVAGR